MMLGQFCGNLYKITNLVINLSNMGVQSRKATTWDPHYLGFHQARQDKIEYADAMLLMCPWCLYGFHSLAQELWRNISFVKHKTLITLIIECMFNSPKHTNMGLDYENLWKTELCLWPCAFFTITLMLLNMSTMHLWVNTSFAKHTYFQWFGELIV